MSWNTGMGTFWDRVLDKREDATDIGHPAESPSERDARVNKQILLVREDMGKAKELPIQIGQETYQCPVIELRSGHWALLGEQAFPVKKDFDKGVFILNQKMQQSSLQDLVVKDMHHTGYHFIKWF